jgi:hypothetical protein
MTCAMEDRVKQQIPCTYDMHLWFGGGGVEDKINPKGALPMYSSTTHI